MQLRLKKRLPKSEADQALSILDSLNITYLHSQQSGISLGIGSSLQEPNGLRQFYLALAQEQTCLFWTADKGLYNAVKKQPEWVYIYLR